MKNGIIKISFVWVILGGVYFLLAFKNPFKTNNLIGNLEPYPDTIYYSLPAWNWVRGRGFKMAVNGIEIKQIVPPLYGFLLSPGFLIFNDVRSFYFINLFLGLSSIYLFLKISKKLFDNVFIAGILALFLVTNFYFYNLPSLLMAENLLIPLSLTAVWLWLKEATTKNYLMSIAVGLLLIFTKISAAPVALVFGVGTLLKYQFKEWGKLIILAAVPLLLAWVMVLAPNWEIYGGGNSTYSLVNIGKNLMVYFKQLAGLEGSYLWYRNPQIEPVLAWAGIVGVLIGLIKNKFRKISIFILMNILAVTIFHAGQEYPEGRYISTLTPLLIIFIGIIIDRAKRFKIPITAGLVLMYLLLRTNVNGFYERKVTTIKRQVMNNFRVENETPWNYLAVQNFNQSFANKNDNSILATLLPPHYVNYFGNGNYQVVPLSPNQEFSGTNKGYVERVFGGEEPEQFFEALIKSGKSVYISNYYLLNHNPSWDADFLRLEKYFNLEEVYRGCMDLCKIYKLELKSTNNKSTSSKLH